MQSVTDRWYVMYARLLLGLSIVLLVGCLLGWFVAPAHFLRHWGFSYITAFLSAIIIVYYFVLFKYQRRHHGAYNAALIMALIQVLNVVNIIHSTGRLHSWFLILWFILLVIAGMFGTNSLSSTAVFIAIYFVLVSTDALGHTSVDPLSIGAVLLTWALCIASYFIWKPHYINQESKQVGKLNTLLKSKQLQSETLSQAISDGVVVIDTDGKILLINPAAAAMAEWPITEAVGINIRTVMVLNGDKGQPLSDEVNPFEKIMDIQQPTNQTVNLVSKTGSQHIVSLVISPVLQQGTQDLAAVVAVFRDVTAAHAEEKRSADFISTASHEMRTPVAAIEGYLALALNEHVSKIDAKARDYLEKAHASTQHLGQLFQDLLTSAKAEDGRLVSHPVIMEMGTYLEQLTDSLRFAAQKKGLLSDFTIGTSTADSEPVAGGKVVRPLYYVLADPDRMREVITNLFDNSVKYTESGRVSIGLTGNDKVVQFFIRDTGHGIPKEDISHLFQKFYRVDNSATRTIGGTGLGLFICRKIVELYNGRIWVDSEFGKGSTFFINLPRVSSSKAVELQQLQSAGQELIISK